MPERGLADPPGATEEIEGAKKLRTARSRGKQCPLSRTARSGAGPTRRGEGKSCCRRAKRLGSDLSQGQDRVSKWPLHNRATRGGAISRAKPHGDPGPPPPFQTIWSERLSGLFFKLSESCPAVGAHWIKRLGPLAPKGAVEQACHAL
jgi:hypothetical protein